MTFKHFGLLLLYRFVILGLMLSGFVYAFNRPDFHAVTLLMFFVVIACIWEYWFFLNKTNREVARFLQAARYTDFNQSFNFQHLGGGFKELGETFTDILNRLKSLRTTQELELRHLVAMVDHIPVPLLSIHSDNSLRLLNNAARRLFGLVQPTKLSDLKQFGNDFFDQISVCKAGENRLAKISIEGIDTKVTLALTEISSNAGSERLISIQDIGKELESTQLIAWQDLVRVLTHEIMNSITPVASLSQTTSDMVNDTKEKLADDDPQKIELKRISDAASTVARRAGNLMKFVSNYRQLTRLPAPEKSQVKLKDLFDHVIKITEADGGNKVLISTEVIPVELELSIDRTQMEQTLINLLNNAKQAVSAKEGAIQLHAQLNQRGRVVITITDNGTGIEEKNLTKIFVPYFTTKKEGSGIGLALARQVIISHGGAIKVETLEAGGARFTLTF